MSSRNQEINQNENTTDVKNDHNNFATEEEEEEREADTIDSSEVESAGKLGISFASFVIEEEFRSHLAEGHHHSPESLESVYFRSDSEDDLVTTLEELITQDRLNRFLSHWNLRAIRYDPDNEFSCDENFADSLSEPPESVERNDHKLIYEKLFHVLQKQPTLLLKILQKYDLDLSFIYD